MKLSVIIPVFNVANTLVRCVESVLGQGVDDLDIVLVDDGSTDESGKICDFLASTNSQIQVVHQANSGLSSARNTGISKASAEYITFVDSDDYLEKQTYSRLLSILSTHPEYDILEYSLVRENADGTWGNVTLADSIYTNMQQYWLQGKAYQHTYAWNKIYRRSLFNEVCFPVGRVFEDAYTLPQLLKKCNTIATTSAGYYRYTRNSNGITATADGYKLQQLLESHLAHPELGMDSSYYCHLLNIQIDVAEATGGTLLLKKQKFYNSPKLLMLQLLGMKCFCKLNKTLHRIWRRNH